MINKLLMIVCVVTVFAAMGCSDKPTYAVKDIHPMLSVVGINGWDKAQVIKDFGKPGETRTSEFWPPILGLRGVSLEQAEEQWHYPLPGEDGILYVWFEKDKVLTALIMRPEW
jgi:hypothetical protein